VKKIITTILISLSIVNAQPQFSAISSLPGAFSRMGFGSRGMGMGNALSAVNEGNLVAYYNPALASFQQGNSFQTSYSILYAIPKSAESQVIPWYVSVLGSTGFRINQQTANSIDASNEKTRAHCNVFFDTYDDVYSNLHVYYFVAPEPSGKSQF